MNRSTRPRSAKSAPPRRPRETAAARGVRAEAIALRLARAFPHARCSLDFESPFQLLVATILSAQCTDKRVNAVTGGLFGRWPTAESLSAAGRDDLEAVIRSTGFFRAKAKSILGCCQALVERHGGQVPRSLDELVRLPGVGRKTANVVMGSAFGEATGVVVDTHVGRISRRLGLTRTARRSGQAEAAPKPSTPGPVQASPGSAGAPPMHRRALLLAALAAPGIARAQAYPTRPIRVVVPFGAGG